LNPALSRGLEGDPISDLELHHLHMGPHLLEKAQARDDAVIEVNEFGLGQLVNINLHGGPVA
jgi:hypothetical protein